MGLLSLDLPFCSSLLYTSTHTPVLVKSKCLIRKISTKSLLCYLLDV